MSRPEQDAVQSSSEGWVARLNSNFAKLLDGPTPLASFEDVASLTSAYNPKLYKDCFCVVVEDLYASDGTVWLPYREKLSFIAPLDTLTATIEDVQTAYNSLLADMQSKGWML